MNKLTVVELLNITKGKLIAGDLERKLKDLSDRSPGIQRRARILEHNLDVLFQGFRPYFCRICDVSVFEYKLTGGCRVDP